METNEFGGDESSEIPGEEEIADKSEETSPSDEETGDGKTPDTTDSDEKEGEDGKEEPSADVPVPQGRFKEVVAQRGELRDENAFLKEKLASLEQSKQEKPADEPTFDLDKAYNDIEEMRENGDLAKAAKLQRQIDDERQKMIVSETSALQKKTPGITRADMAQIRYENAIGHAVNTYPELNENSQTFDAQKAGDVDGWADVYIAQGKPSDVALSMALEKVMGPVASGKDANKEPGKSELRKREGKLRRDVSHGAPRTSTGGEGSRNSPEGYDIETMTVGQFDSLPESEKEKLLYPSRR